MKRKILHCPKCGQFLLFKKEYVYWHRYDCKCGIIFLTLGREPSQIERIEVEIIKSKFKKVFIEKL
ncbi:hypothetical protein HY745_02815 [Candidatus Desantisbacteria bacterium]|nr:hypothetical protein [Candidatus Desantisbacteria bacterium]